MTKKLPTVEDVLSKDDITCIASDLVEGKDRVEDVVVIYSTGDGQVGWNANGVTTSQFIYMMELVKHVLLSGEDE